MVKEVCIYQLIRELIDVDNTFQTQQRIFMILEIERRIDY